MRTDSISYVPSFMLSPATGQPSFQSRGRMPSTLAPRACQIAQNVQRWSQPVWIATKLFTWPMNPDGAMTPGGPKALNLLEFPTTRETSGIASKDHGSSSAAQPVTRIRAAGRRRWARRIDWRVCRTASLVTAQLLTTIQSSPAGASLAIVSLSAKLSRQPRVTVCTLTQASPGPFRRRIRKSLFHACGSGCQASS